MLTAAYAAEICAVGREAGLDEVGVATAEPFAETRRVLEQRRAEGLAGSMQFTYRNPARSTDPSRTLAGVASLVVGARRYDRPVPPPPDRRPQARVARYASDDHYASLRHGLDAVASRLVGDGWRARVVLDDNAMVDRAAAQRAGLGWYGKNANILVPGVGSWVVLGSVLTDAPLPPAAGPRPDGCGTCRRCLDGCPTGAIVAAGVVDARRCLAWLVQAPGWFPAEWRVALGDRLYGCDDCQEVCPPSRRAPAASADPQDLTPAGPGSWVDVLDLLKAPDDELLARFGAWYIAERQPRYLRRNALVVLGNVGEAGSPEVAAALRAALGYDDPLIRGHAVWAARRLGLDPADLGFDAATEPDPQVRAELGRAVAPRS